MLEASDQFSFLPFPVLFVRSCPFLFSSALPSLLPCGFPCSLFSHLTCACQPACHGQPAIASLLGCLVAWLCVAASEPAAEPTTPRVLISGLGVLTTSFVSKCKTFPQVSGCQTWLLGPIGTDSYLSIIRYICLERIEIASERPGNREAQFVDPNMWVSIFRTVQPCIQSC